MSGGDMGTTKLKIKQIAAIKTDDLAVDGFEMNPDMECSYVVNHPVEKGEIVLIKASFKNACETEEETEDENVLYRRRVVPFITRVRQAYEPERAKKNRRVRVKAKIERITDEDRRFFLRKYFATTSETDPLNLEMEGKRICFDMVV